MFWQTIEHDLFRYTGKKLTIPSLFTRLFTPGFRYTFVFRWCQYTSRYTPLGMLGRFLFRRYKFRYGFQIPYQTKIGKGLYLGHFGGVVINSKVVVGENCNIAHNVTIGQTNRGKNIGAPTIGNSVWIGTGSVLIGGIKIGNNVLISPLSNIFFDVPDNSIVIDGKVIPNDKATEGYINRILTNG